MPPFQYFFVKCCRTRKAALGDSPVDCRNRRGFSAEKRVRPPLPQRKNANRVRPPLPQRKNANRVRPPVTQSATGRATFLVFGHVNPTAPFCPNQPNTTISDKICRYDFDPKLMFLRPFLVIYAVFIIQSCTQKYIRLSGYPKS